MVAKLFGKTSPVIFAAGMGSGQAVLERRQYSLLDGVDRRLEALRKDALSDAVTPGQRRDRLLALDGAWVPLDYAALVPNQPLAGSGRVLFCRALRGLTLAGLVEVLRADGARRTTHIRMTAKGRKMHKALRAAFDATPQTVRVYQHGAVTVDSVRRADAQNMAKQGRSTPVPIVLAGTVATA